MNILWIPDLYAVYSTINAKYPLWCFKSILKAHVHRIMSQSLLSTHTNLPPLPFYSVSANDATSCRSQKLECNPQNLLLNWTQWFSTRAILPHRGWLAMFIGILGCHNWGLVAGMLLNVVGYTGQPLHTKESWPKMSILQRLRHCNISSNVMDSTSKIQLKSINFSSS